MFFPKFQLLEQKFAVMQRWKCWAQKLCSSFIKTSNILFFLQGSSQTGSPNDCRSSAGMWIVSSAFQTCRTALAPQQQKSLSHCHELGSPGGRSPDASDCQAHTSCCILTTPQCPSWPQIKEDKEKFGGNEKQTPNCVNRLIKETTKQIGPTLCPNFMKSDWT